MNASRSYGIILILVANCAATEAATPVNLAPAAEPSTSHVSRDTSLVALHDGHAPKTSHVRGNGSYGNWPSKRTQWVQYDWPAPVRTRKIDVFWWDDHGGVRLPKACRLLYWDGKRFVPVRKPSGLGVAKDTFNTTTFDEVRTSKLRLEIDGNGDYSTGILEWKVYNEGKLPNFPLAAVVGFGVAYHGAKNVDGKLVIQEHGQTIVVEGWGEDSLRVRVTPPGSKQTSDWALDIPLESKGKVEITPWQAVIRNGKISCRISDSQILRNSHRLHMEFFKHDGDKRKRILSEYDYGVPAHNPGVRVFKSADDGLFEAELHLASHKAERFYGMGLNAEAGTLNLKGSVIDLYQRHVKHVVPFVVSSEGYGFLWNNPSLGRVEFGTRRVRWVSSGCKQIDYFITAGDSYADIMSNYADATGHAPKFPYWASGFWMCKLRYATQKDFLDAAREFKKRGLPLAVHVIDYKHWDVLGNWKLDPKFWPNPKAMVKEINDMGARIMISPWVLVSPKSENFKHMKDNNMFVTSRDGKKDAINYWGPSYQYDPTNPEAGKFLWSKWKQNYFDIGIRTFWLDPSDDLHEIQDFDQMLYKIGPATEANGYYPVAHQKNVYEGLVSAGEKEVVIISRSCWAGSQRYGAAPAHHDILSSFEHFEEYVRAYLNLGMSGIPWGATGIGGFVPREEGERFHELMIRWYQYGVFCPVFRTHGKRSDNEPWKLGGDSYTHIREALFLRERLRPYVMKQMALASDKGIPPMRPVFFDFDQIDPKTAEIEDQFLFGPDLLVAPITRFGQRSREVYLPGGVDWTDAWTGKKFKGGQTIKADAPIERIPVYLRGDQPKLLKLFKEKAPKDPSLVLD